MTVELITGHAGSAHVSSADAGWLNAGTFGTGKYVLDTQTKFACNVQSANLVTVGTGDAVFEGRHVRVSATENVAIDNGAQGVNRNDIVCIKYEYDNGTSEESASLAVVKGTAVSGTPSDPTIPSGSILSGSSTAYMPLWRIPISGITVGTPEKMYGDVIVTLKGLLSKTWTASQIPSLAASKITSGTLDAARIPNLDASKITSGTLAAARIPGLDASKLTSGTIADARLPTKGSAGTAGTSSATSGATLAVPYLTTDAYGRVTAKGTHTHTIGSLNASATTAGTFDAARIPSLDASKIGSGTLGVARGGTGKTYGFTWQQLATSTDATAMSYSLSGYSEVMFAAYSGTNYIGSVVLPVSLLSTTARQVWLSGGSSSGGSTPYAGRGFVLSATSTKATPTLRNIDGTYTSSATWYTFAR